MKRMQTVQFPTQREARPVRIVGDAAVATGSLSEGRLIPVIIVDVSDRPDITELVRVHKILSSGDVTFQWAQLDNNQESVVLLMEFERPAKLKILLEFDIESRGSLVDLMLRSRAFFLQPGCEGDRFSANLKSPRIILEIPEMGFGSEWEKLLMQSLINRFRNKGLSRGRAKQAARDFLKEWRHVSGMRMPS